MSQKPSHPAAASGGFKKRGRRRRLHGGVWEWLDAVARDRFLRRQAFEAGNWAALLDAFGQALTDSPDADPDAAAPMPRWALRAAFKVVAEHMREVKTRPPKKGSRSARWAARYRQDLVDWHRFLTVWYLNVGADDYSEMSPARARKARRDLLAKVTRSENPDHWTAVDPYPHPFTDTVADMSAFQAAHLELRSTVYAGSPRTMKESWLRVTKALRNGESWRYYPSRWLMFKGHSRSADSFIPK